VARELQELRQPGERLLALRPAAQAQMVDHELETGMALGEAIDGR